MKKTINYLFASAAVVALVALGSCSDDEKLPPIDGYNNSDEVAPDNLVANWTFDGNNTEDISGASPLAGAAGTFGTVGFEEGKIGQALKLTQGALVYPTITGLNTADALGNFTVSLWVKAYNNKKTANQNATAIFALLYSDDDDIWGNISMLAETGANLPSSDTLLLKPLLKTLLDGSSTSLQDNISGVNGDKGQYFLGAKDWVHYVVRWNGSTHKFEIFANGENVGAYSERGDTPALKMRVPTQAVFGSLSYNDIGFENAPDRGIPLATASIDDVRIFNTNLADADIKALFNLGSAGR